MLIVQSLMSMAELRETVNFLYKAEVERAVGVAVKVLGPEAVIEAIPLLITGKEYEQHLQRIVPVHCTFWFWCIVPVHCTLEFWHTVCECARVFCNL